MPCEEVPIKCILFPVLRKPGREDPEVLIPGMEAKGNWVIDPQESDFFILPLYCMWVTCLCL